MRSILFKHMYSIIFYLLYFCLQIYSNMFKNERSFLFKKFTFFFTEIIQFLFTLNYFNRYLVNVEEHFGFLTKNKEIYYLIFNRYLFLIDFHLFTMSLIQIKFQLFFKHKIFLFIKTSSSSHLGF